MTPQQEYWPVDSGRDAGWQETLAAHRAGELSADHDRAYFGKRPVLELYDLDNDPGELHNLAGRGEVKDVQETLAAALPEKLITDYDFVPPVIKEALPPRPPAKNAAPPK